MATVNTGAFVTVTITGIASGILHQTAGDIQASIEGALFSDFSGPISVVVDASADRELFGGQPYRAVIVVKAPAEFGSPDDVAAIIAHDVGVGVGAFPASVGPATVGSTSPSPTLPSDGSWVDRLKQSVKPVADALQIDLGLVVIGLVALLALAIIVLAPELKAGLRA